MSVYVIFNIKGHAGEMKVPQKKAKNKQTSKSEKVKKVKQRNRMRWQDTKQNSTKQNKD